MQRQNYLYHTVYKITNQLNGKIYIGAHSTSKLDDGYMGSGTHLKRAYKLHGIENFKKEILFIYDTLEEAFNKEAEIVNEEFIKNQSNYNIALGGQIPLYGFLGGKHSDETKNAISELHMGENNPFFGKTHTQQQREKISKRTSGKLNPMHNHQWGDESRHKMSLSKSGQVWWNNGITSTQSKISPGDNWKRGRLSNDLVWWTDGDKSIMAIECPGDEWARGRTFRHQTI